MATPLPEETSTAAIVPKAASNSLRYSGLAWLQSEPAGYLALFLIVVIAYLPVWQAGFFWDDLIYVTSNPKLLTLQGLVSLWTTKAADISPLTFTTFGLEHALWGSASLPYHLVNVVLHASSAMVLWRVLRQLKIVGAWLGAALWAVHPVEVESVAWITEMKNTESGLFYLLALLFFTKGLKVGGGGRGLPREILWSTLFAALAMACKSSTVILPAVMCLCAWWIDGCWRWRSIVLAAPAFILSILGSALAIWTQRLQIEAAADPQWIRSWPQRFAGAGDAIWFYLGKFVWPHPLIVVYPRWTIDAVRVESYLPLLAAAGIIALLWLKRKSWGRPWFFTFAYFVIALLPGLGLIDNVIFRYSLVFDHFQYLASMGPAALLGAGLAGLARATPPERRWISCGAVTALFLVLIASSWQRAGVFESDPKVWADTVTKNPRCWIAYNNLGMAGSYDGRLNDAQVLFQKALALNPHYDGAENNLGSIFMRKGEVAQAMIHFRKAIEFNPDFDISYRNIGDLLQQQGKFNDAIAAYRQALRINSDSCATHCSYGNVLMKSGQIDLAADEFNAALKADPSSAFAHCWLGIIALQKGDNESALAHLQKAIELDPSMAPAHENLGRVLANKGDRPDAIAQFETALQIDPNLAAAHRDLAIALAQSGQLDAALQQFREVLRLNPGDKEDEENLAKAQTLFQKTEGK